MKRNEPTTTGARAMSSPSSSSSSSPSSLSRVFAATYVFSRTAFAVCNAVVLDCDETYNYLEPLHYAWRAHGLQTWENARSYALRSRAFDALYLPFVYVGDVFGGALFGDFKRGTTAFAFARAATAIGASASELMMYDAVRSRNALCANVMMLMFAFATGNVMASSAVLPSSLAMACVSAACAKTLRGKHREACAWCVFGCVFGWPFAGIAAIPIGVYSMYAIGVTVTARWVIACTAVAAAVSTACDSAMYSPRGAFGVVSSVVNLVRYNVAGGKSDLYGVEGAGFYVKNLALNFQLAFALACAAPFAVSLAVATKAFALRELARSGNAPKAMKLTTVMENYRNNWRVLLFVCTPFPIVTAFFTAVPHKEERFLYMIYPCLCLSAAIAVTAFTESALRITRHAVRSKIPIYGIVFGVVLGLFVMIALSISRTAAILKYYGAPAKVYGALPVPSATPDTVKWPWYLANEYIDKGDDMTINVCVGDEWYRFPSSFHFPTKHYRLRFLKTKFNGALPMPFDTARGGTAYTPIGLNDENKAHENQYVDPDECYYVVEAEFESANAHTTAIGGDWIDVHSEKFINPRRSPTLTRVFYIPGYSEKRNAYVDYKLKVLAYPKNTFASKSVDADLKPT